MAEAKLSGPMKLLQKKLNERVPVHDTGSPQEQGLRVGALNVNSIITLARCEKVQELIKDNSFDIFAITETKLQKDDHKGNQWDLGGYSYVRKDRRYAIKKEKGKQRKKTKNTGIQTQPNSTRGGGILIYIHESVNYKVKSRGEYAESNVEFLHIEITSPVQLHLVALYCPNKNFAGDLISLMSYFMDPLGVDKKIMFIGDTNIDKYGVQPQDYLGNTFFEVLKKRYGVKQIIDKATHIFMSCEELEPGRKVRKQNESCIDHIFTNLDEPERGVMAHRVAGASLDYHQVIYCTLPVSVPYWILQNELRRLWRKTSGNACTLAIFCKFSQADEMPQVEGSVSSRANGEETVYYMKFDDQKKIGQQKRLLQPVIDKTENIQQWAIFSYNTTSMLYKKLKKHMDVFLNTSKWKGYTQEAAVNTFYGVQGTKTCVKKFMEQLVVLMDSCILAVFYKFSRSAPNIEPKRNVERYRHNRELACYITIDNVDKVENRIRLIQGYIDDVNKADGSATHKQCIIFTRNSQSPVFDALQKRMWYKDWDFVWQPRHVEFLGYVLEPSLTYAFRIKGGTPVWNIPATEEEGKQEQQKAIALQECTYRYWSDYCKCIERM